MQECQAANKQCMKQCFVQSSTEMFHACQILQISSVRGISSTIGLGQSRHK